MPINSFSVGKDVTLDFVSPLTGGLVQFSNITEFSSNQMSTERNSHGIDGENRFLDIPSGWEGTFNMDRNSEVFDLYISAYEAAYYAGQALTASRIVETITEADGTISQFVYTGVSVKFPNVGKWRGDDKVEQQMTFKASKRQQLI